MINTISNPKVSVICNCYNGAVFLRQAIESVLNQTYKNFEFILIDNFSNDETAKIFHSYLDERMKYFKTKSHIKLGEARNFSLKFIDSDYVAFIDADDIWTERKLSVQINNMLSNNINLSYCQAKIFYEDGRENFYSKRNKNTILDTNELSKDFDVCFSSLVFSVDLLDEGELFNSSLEVTEDADFIFKLMRKASIGYIADSLVFYRSYENSLTWQKPHLFINDLNIMEKEYKLIGIKSEILDPLYRSAYWVNFLYNWKNGRKKSAFKYLFKIKRWQLRHYISLIIVFFPYELISKILKIFNKKVV